MKKIIVTDADGLADNKEEAFCALSISKREIDSGNISSALERCMVFNDTRENTLLYRESLILHVGGYDNDARELSEIPEVRQFFKKLVNEWPHWPWFLARNTDTIVLLMGMLCKIKIHRSGIQLGTEFLDNNELAAVMKDLFSRGNRLFAHYKIEAQLVNQSAKSFGRELIGMT